MYVMLHYKPCFLSVMHISTVIKGAVFADNSQAIDKQILHTYQVTILMPFSLNTNRVLFRVHQWLQILSYIRYSGQRENAHLFYMNDLQLYGKNFEIICLKYLYTLWRHSMLTSEWILAMIRLPQVFQRKGNWCSYVESSYMLEQL